LPGKATLGKSRFLMARLIEALLGAGAVEFYLPHHSARSFWLSWLPSWRSLPGFFC